jgi:hypothetical protein
MIVAPPARRAPERHAGLRRAGGRERLRARFLPCSAHVSQSTCNALCNAFDSQERAGGASTPEFTPPADRFTAAPLCTGAAAAGSVWL